MEFEFDPVKSASNLREHGIALDDAQALWRDPDRLEVPARSSDEPRVQVILRIISVRRARDEEEEAYRQN